MHEAQALLDQALDAMKDHIPKDEWAFLHKKFQQMLDDLPRGTSINTRYVLAQLESKAEVYKG
jgi:hypothetical protein